MYVLSTDRRTSEADANDVDPELDHINFRISRSFFGVVEEARRERGFDSQREFIRYALREAVNHPDGAGFWNDLAISEAQFDEGEGIPSNEVNGNLD